MKEQSRTEGSKTKCYFCGKDSINKVTISIGTYDLCAECMKRAAVERRKLKRRKDDK